MIFNLRAGKRRMAAACHQQA